MTTTGTVYGKTLVCRNTPMPVEHTSVFAHTANFHVEDQDCYYGDGTNMKAIGKATAVISLDKLDLKDLFFMNKTAGQVATIQIVATVDKQHTVP